MYTNAWHSTEVKEITFRVGLRKITGVFYKGRETLNQDTLVNYIKRLYNGTEPYYMLTGHFGKKLVLARSIHYRNFAEEIAGIVFLPTGITDLIGISLPIKWKNFLKISDTNLQYDKYDRNNFNCVIANLIKTAELTQLIYPAT